MIVIISMWISLGGKLKLKIVFLNKGTKKNLQNTYHKQKFFCIFNKLYQNFLIKKKNGFQISQIGGEQTQFKRKHGNQTFQYEEWIRFLTQCQK